MKKTFVYSGDSLPYWFTRLVTFVCGEDGNPVRRQGSYVCETPTSRFLLTPGHIIELDDKGQVRAYY